MSLVQIEDFTDQSQNVARAVGVAEMKPIYKSIQNSIRHVLAFMSDHIDGSMLQELLFGQDFKLPLAAATTTTTRLCCVSQVINADKFEPNVAQPQPNGREENLQVMNSNSLLTKRLLPVDGWGRWPSTTCQQMEMAMIPLANNWAGMQSCSSEIAQKPVNDDDWKGSQQSISSFPSTSGSRTQGSARSKFHSVNNNPECGFHKSSFPVSWRGRPSKKRRRF